MRSTQHNRLTAVLATWPFIASLVTLLANDWWLKQAHPGLITGKLSDFAGIAVITMLLLAAATQKKPLILLAIATGFAWWKSPLSQPLLDSLNLYLPFTVGRTVDYTDLLALGVIPFCVPVASEPARFQLGLGRIRPLIVGLVAMTTVFAVSATSIRPTLVELKVSQRNPAAELNHTVIAAAVADLARKRDLECQECSDTSTGARYWGDGAHLSYSFPDSRTVVFRLEAFPDGVLFSFGDSGPEKARKLIAALRERLSRTYENLEFLERFPPDIR